MDRAVVDQRHGKPCAASKTRAQHDRIPRLKVLLVGNYQYDQQESMQRFARVLFERFTQVGVDVHVCSPQPFFGRWRPSPTGIGKWLGYIDKLLIFPATLKRHIRVLTREAQQAGTKLFVHICDHSNSFYTRCLRGVPHLVTCNDMLAIRSAKGEIPQNPTRWSGRLLQKMILRGLKQANTVACISHATRQDLLRISSLEKENARVIHMGLNFPYSPVPKNHARRIISELLPGNTVLIDETAPRFILHVGGNHWYKNRVGVLRIYSALRNMLQSKNEFIPKLVMAGKAPSSDMQEVFTQEPELASEVVILQGVDNEQLAALYSAAELLLFPSIEEGFGWPIIEAQACGCRVVTTRRAPMTEVGGDAAIYLDPEDVRASAPGGFVKAASIVANVLNEDAATRQQRIARGIENAERFTTDKMIRAYLDLYEELSRGQSADSSPAA